jgi:hypothetical protein
MEPESLLMHSREHAMVSVPSQINLAYSIPPPEHGQCEDMYVHFVQIVPVRWIQQC